MIFRFLPIAASLLLTVPLYAQETPSAIPGPSNLVADLRSQALFGIGCFASLVGILGSLHKPYQGKGVAVMRSIAGIMKFTLGIAFITSSDRITYEIDQYKKLTLPQKTDHENEFQRYRRSI